MNISAEQRFWSKVSKSCGHGPAGECWEWQRGISCYGYGVFFFNYQPYRAHRFAYEIAKGPIPDGLVVMHSCDNRACVNPAHLSVGTRLDNARDMSAKGRSAGQKKTACPAGHPYTPENTYTEKSGKRKCKACTKARDAIRTWR